MTRQAGHDARRGAGGDTSSAGGRTRRRLPHPTRSDVPAAHVAPTSGTLSSHDDTDDLPVVDEGMAVAPDELGQQFLRNATEQDNYELEAASSELEPNASAIGQLISEATLSASGQGEREVPESTALLHDEPDGEHEPKVNDGSLLSNATRDASLFDQPRESESHLEEVDESQLEVDEVRSLDEHRGPPGIDEGVREEEKRRLKRKLASDPDRRRR